MSGGYLYLSRNDTAQVSRFSGYEVKDTHDVDWLETNFIPSLYSLTESHAAKPVKGPLSFWAGIGGGLFPQARWEIFIYSTPYTLMNPLMKPLKDLDHSSICEGARYLDEDALPFCQIFRGKLIRFYLGDKNAKKFQIPLIYWNVDQPVLALKELDVAFILSEDAKTADSLWVRAEVVGKARRDFLSMGEGPTGNYYRYLQRGLPGLAIPE